MSEAPQALMAVLEPVVEAQGLALYDVELVGGTGRARTVRVLIADRSEVASEPGASEPGATEPGAIGLDAIGTATTAISTALDRATDDATTGVARVLSGSYTLEVSSPGLERPLRSIDHWRGALGAIVSVRTTSDDETLRRRGTVLAVHDDTVEIEFDGVGERVAFADVVQARTVFEWGPAPKPGGPKSGKKSDQRSGSAPRTRRANEKVKQ